MDTTTLIIIGIIVLLGLYLFNRNRVKPPGTYNDPNYRSSGSIGSGPAYDDENYRSSGSIGGQRRTDVTPPPSATGQGSERPRHDSPDFKSGGSIGGSSAPPRTSAHNSGSSSSPSSGKRPALRGRDAEE